MKAKKEYDSIMKRLFRISDKLERSIEENLKKDVEIKSYKELTAAIKDALAIRRNLYGLPTQSEELAQKIAFEKIDIDRAKLGSDDQGKTVSVEFSHPEFSE